MRAEAIEIWNQVKANHRTLESCRGPHDFQPVQVEGQRLVRKYCCTKCGGTIDSTDLHWYQRGLQHGGLAQ